MSASTKRHPDKSCPNGRRGCIFCTHAPKIRSKERVAELAEREQVEDASAVTIESMER